MMLDHLNGGGDYERGLWLKNGGNATLASLGQNSSMDSLIQFVKGLPLWIRMDDLVVNPCPDPASLGS